MKGAWHGLQGPVLSPSTRGDRRHRALAHAARLRARGGGSRHAGVLPGRADAEYYLGLARQMGGEFFRSTPKLKLVQLLSAGYDRVDIEAARKAGVPVANNGGANAIAVAEHAILLMLAVLKRLVRFHNDVVAGKWRVGDMADGRVFELAGKTLGVVGLGNIGKKVARRAAAFDMDI